MLEEGALPGQIDKVLFEFGFPMVRMRCPTSPASICNMRRALRGATASRNASALRTLSTSSTQWVATDRRPVPAGTATTRTQALPDPAIDALLAAHSSARGLTRRPFTEQEILERCLYAMVNEGAKLIGEGIVPRPDEVDVAMINGIGFPGYTGGPLWWADSIGLEKIVAAMRGFAAHGGDEWIPAPLLAELAASGGRFYPGSAAAWISTIRQRRWRCSRGCARLWTSTSVRTRRATTRAIRSSGTPE